MAKLIVVGYTIAQKPFCDFVHESGKVTHGLIAQKQTGGGWSVNVSEHCVGRKWKSLSKSPKLGETVEFVSYKELESEDEKLFKKQVHDKARPEASEPIRTNKLIMLTSEELDEYNEARALITTLETINNERILVRDTKRELEKMPASVLEEILREFMKHKASEIKVSNEIAIIDVDIVK